MNKKKHTLGVRIPDHVVALSLVEEMGEPILSSTLLMPGEEEPLSEFVNVVAKVAHLVDAIIDSPCGSTEATTVLNLVDSAPVLVRAGAGPVDFLD